MKPDVTEAVKWGGMRVALDVATRAVATRAATYIATWSALWEFIED